MRGMDRQRRGFAGHAGGLICEGGGFVKRISCPLPVIRPCALWVMQPAVLAGAGEEIRVGKNEGFLVDVVSSGIPLCTTAL